MTLKLRVGYICMRLSALRVLCSCTRSLVPVAKILASGTTSATGYPCLHVIPSCIAFFCLDTV